MEHVDTLDKHFSEPHKSLESYANERRLILGEQLRNCKKIYLDTKYWILLRNSSLGIGSDPFIRNLLESLENGVSSGDLICPIGADTFVEILKQTDEMTLLKSVSLIDHLSQGVAILFHEDRFRLEILNFVYKNLFGESSYYPPEVSVWTKLAYILGLYTPGNTFFKQEEELAMQKSFLDQMWQISLADMVNVIGITNLLTRPLLYKCSDELNRNKKQFGDNCKSFEEVFLSELASLLDYIKPQFSDMLLFLSGRFPQLQISKEDADAPQSAQLFANLIYHAFRLKRLSNELPFLRIQASLHTAIWMDTARRYKPTDMHDIFHATAALPYFDVFLTERSLKHLLTRTDMGLDRLYHCCVVAKPTEATTEIENLLAGK